MLVVIKTQIGKARTDPLEFDGEFGRCHEGGGRTTTYVRQDSASLEPIEQTRYTQRFLSGINVHPHVALEAPECSQPWV